MNTTTIIIEENGVTLRASAGDIWLTESQIADTFGVFISAVNANIRSILKNGIFRKEEVCRHRDTGKGSIMTQYNMEMITALAFRLQSRPARYFRKWITERALSPVVLWKIPGFDTMLN